ncbi:MAG: ribonuclease E inhibitor RraB [Phycisphaerae bacterium]
MTQPDNLPDNADGDALRQLAEDGSRLDKPMEINFPVICPSQETALDIAAAAMEQDFDVDVWQDEETSEWICECSLTMVPHYDDLLGIQQALDELARPFGGKSDGWGTFGNAR